MMRRRCGAEAGGCGSPLLSSGPLRPTSGLRPLATSGNNSPEHLETPALSTNTKRKRQHRPKHIKHHSLR